MAISNASSEDATNQNRDPAVIARLLQGAVDLHCHSGPSVMPRELDHVEAMNEAAEVGMKAILVKDHYYSAAPITELLNRQFSKLGVLMLSGVPLNNASGGFNPHAVDHGVKLGARLVWMPTFSSANHIAHHKQDAEFHLKFPQTKEQMLPPVPLTVLDDAGKLRDDVLYILDMIATNDLVLSAGHLHISEIWPLFEAAKSRGVQRLLVNHPSYVVDASLQDVRALSNMGAYIEHSMCMWVPGSKFKFYEPEFLQQLIEAATVGKTILGSDLGQSGNPRPVAGFRNVIATCLDLGYEEEQVREMISTNACELLGLD
jgi:hypothetical protein